MTVSKPTKCNLNCHLLAVTTLLFASQAQAATSIAAPAPLAAAAPMSEPAAAPLGVAAPMPAATSVEQSRAFSLALGFPAGGSAWLGGSLGGWYMASQRVNLGLNVAVLADPHRTDLGDDTFSKIETKWGLLIQPAMKIYVVEHDRVAPYVWGSVLLGLGGDNGQSDTATVAIGGGVGAEVFFLHYLSLSGQVGLQLDVARGDSERPPAKLSSLTSGLAANIYF